MNDTHTWFPEDTTSAVPSHVIKIWVHGNPSTFTLTGLQVLPPSPPLFSALCQPCAVPALPLSADHLHLVPPSADEVCPAWSFVSTVGRGWLLLLEWQGAQAVLCSTEPAVPQLMFSVFLLLLLLRHMQPWPFMRQLLAAWYLFPEAAQCLPEVSLSREFWDLEDFKTLLVWKTLLLSIWKGVSATTK